MHDLDRTQLEQPYEFESAGETALGEILGHELEHTSGETETQELELASRLLEVQSEDELEQFLGDVLSSVVSGAKQLAATPTGQALTGILKDAAKQALPVVGGAIGRAISPSSGQVWGQRAGSAAADLLGLELEGLSQEDREFEVAKRVVQMGRESWQNLARASAAGHVPAAAPVTPAPGVHPAVAAAHPAAVAARAQVNGITPQQLLHVENAVARQAAADAAKRFMPGLVATLERGERATPPHHHHREGMRHSPIDGPGIAGPGIAAPGIVGPAMHHAFAATGRVPTVAGNGHVPPAAVPIGAPPPRIASPSAAFAGVPAPGVRPPGIPVPGVGPVGAPAWASPSVAFATRAAVPPHPGVPGIGGPGVPAVSGAVAPHVYHHLYRHLPVHGQWRRHGRHLIVFLG
jgi:hypothetical protein